MQIIPSFVPIIDMDYIQISTSVTILANSSIRSVIEKKSMGG